MFRPPTFALPLQEIVFWRGAFLHYYSTVEHATNDLLLRALASGEYRRTGKMPRSWAGRLRLLGRLFDEPGLLHPFATRWRDLLTSLTFVEKDRHLLTHGMLNAEMNEAKELTLTFTAYDFHHERRETLTKTVDEMRYLVGRFGDEAEAYLILIAEILKATRFDILPVGPLQPLPREPRDF